MSSNLVKSFDSRDVATWNKKWRSLWKSSSRDGTAFLSLQRYKIPRDSGIALLGLDPGGILQSGDLFCISSKLLIACKKTLKPLAFSDPLDFWHEMLKGIFYRKKIHFLYGSNWSCTQNCITQGFDKEPEEKLPQITQSASLHLYVL